MDLINYTFPIVHFLSVLTAAGHILSVFLLVSIIVRSKGKIVTWFEKNALGLILVIALVATAGSLFLSEIAGWNPCKYCWIQRIFMYPQIIIAGIALWKKDATAVRYILALSIVGLCYASYHYYIQMYDIIASPTNPATPCDLSGESCVKTPFVTFGYITIPMMAWTAFLLNILGSVLMLRRNSPLKAK